MISTKDQNLYLQIEDLEKAGCEKISGTTYERELIRERTNAGLQCARARGRTGGRLKGFSTKTIQEQRFTV